MKTTRSTKTSKNDSFLQAFAGTQPGTVRPVAKSTVGGIQIGGTFTPAPMQGSFLDAFAPKR